MTSDMSLNRSGPNEFKSILILPILSKEMLSRELLWDKMLLPPRLEMPLVLIPVPGGYGLPWPSTMITGPAPHTSVLCNNSIKS